MKTAIALLTLTLAQILSPTAQANGVVLEASLDQFQLDPIHTQSYASPVHGTIVLDLGAKTAELTVNYRRSCPPRMACPAVMPAPRVVTVPITHVTTDTCGSVVYHASRDKRPVDGVFSALTITDNTGNRCPHFHFVAMAATEVVYETSFYNRINRGESSGISKMTGGALRR